MAIVTSDIRKRILAARPAILEEFHIPEWDATVWIKELTLKERDTFEADQIVREEDGSVRMETQGLKARLIIMCVCDEEGNKVFTDADEEAVGGLGASGTERLFAACQRVNKMRKQDAKELLSDPNASRRNGASASA